MKRMTSHQLRAFCRQSHVTLKIAEEIVTENDYSSSPEPEDPEYFRSGPHVHNEVSYVAKWPYDKVFMPDSSWVGTREYQLEAAYDKTPKEVIGFAVHAFLDEDDKYVQLAVLSNGTHVNRFMMFQFRLLTEWSRFEYVTKHYIVYIIDELSLWVNHTFLNVDDMKLWGEVANSTNVTLEMSFKYNVDHDYICHEPGHKKTISCYLAKRRFKKISMRRRPTFLRTAQRPERLCRKRTNNEPLPQFSTLKLLKTQANPLLFGSPLKRPSVDELIGSFGWGTKGYFSTIPITSRTIAEQSTYPLEVRQPQVTADPASYPIVIGEPYTIADQATYSIAIGQPEDISDAPICPINIRQRQTAVEPPPYSISVRQRRPTGDQTTYSMSFRQPQVTANQFTYPTVIRQPQVVAGQPTHPFVVRQHQAHQRTRSIVIRHPQATAHQRTRSMAIRHPQPTAYQPTYPLAIRSPEAINEMFVNKKYSIVTKVPNGLGICQFTQSSGLIRDNFPNILGNMEKRQIPSQPQPRFPLIPPRRFRLRSFSSRFPTSELRQNTEFKRDRNTPNCLKIYGSDSAPQPSQVNANVQPYTQGHDALTRRESPSVCDAPDRNGYTDQELINTVSSSPVTCFPIVETQFTAMQSSPRKNTSPHRRPTRKRIIIYCDGRRRQYEISSKILEKASPVMKAFIDFTKPVVTANGDCYCELDGVTPFVLETLIQYLTNDSYSENIFKSRLMKEAAHKLQIDLG